MGEIYRVTIEYDVPHSSTPNNVFHYHNEGIATPTDAALLSAIDDWVQDSWAGAWVDLADTNAELVLFNVDEMNTDGTVYRNIGSVPVNEPGVVANDVMPAAVAGYIMAYTGLPKHRGSKYIPGLTESMAAGGELTSAALAILADLLIAYLLDITVTPSVELAPGILSTTLEQFVKFVVLGIVESTPAYQRRRKPGVGS